MEKCKDSSIRSIEELLAVAVAMQNGLYVKVYRITTLRNFYKSSTEQRS